MAVKVLINCPECGIAKYERASVLLLLVDADGVSWSTHGEDPLSHHTIEELQEMVLKVLVDATAHAQEDEER